MKIYAISGLGADKRVFSKLDVNSEIVCVDWIEPFRNENLNSYAKRLIKEYSIDQDTCILGVSFGGLIAVEISKLIKPKLTILISSVETKTDLPIIYRLIGLSKILHLVPQKILNPPKFIAKWMFGAKDKQLLYDILDETNLYFAKWAIIQLMSWDNKQRFENCLRIHGNRDKLIPLKRSENTILINNGAHFMIADNAKDISAILNKAIEKMSS